MNKTHVKIGLLAMAGLIAASLPTHVDAQTTTRRQNLEVNRDVRNVKLRATSTMPVGDIPVPARIRVASTTRMDVRADIRADMREKIELRAATWANRPNTPIRLASTTLMRKFASSTELRDHKKWKDTSLERFAFLHNKLITEVERPFGTIKDLRMKIGERIRTAESNGRDMTNAKAAIIKADDKIAAAELAIKALIAYTPPVVASSTVEVSADANVNLERPRALGKVAIDAIKEAKDALQEVVRAIAQDMGLKRGQNATSTSATSTNP